MARVPLDGPTLLFVDQMTCRLAQCTASTQSSAFLGSGPPSGIPCCSLLTLEAIFEIDESESRSKYGGYIGLHQTFSACWGLGGLVSGVECQGTWVRITKSGIAATGDSGRTRRGTETGDQGTMDVDVDAGADVRTVDVGAGADARVRGARERVDKSGGSFIGRQTINQRRRAK